MDYVLWNPKPICDRDQYSKLIWLRDQLLFVWFHGSKNSNNVLYLSSSLYFAPLLDSLALEVLEGNWHSSSLVLLHEKLSALLISRAFNCYELPVIILLRWLFRALVVIDFRVVAHNPSVVNWNSWDSKRHSFEFADIHPTPRVCGDKWNLLLSSGSQSWCGVWYFFVISVTCVFFGQAFCWLLVVVFFRVKKHRGNFSYYFVWCGVNCKATFILIARLVY